MGNDGTCTRARWAGNAERQFPEWMGNETEDDRLTIESGVEKASREGNNVIEVD